MSDTDYSGYVSTFITGTASACTSENVTSAIWQDLEDAFALLSVDEQGYFAGLSYSHNQEATNSVYNVVDRYDYIVAKYGYNDFMNRKDAGTWKDYFHFNDDTLPPDDPNLLKIFGIQGESNMTYVIIIAASVVTLSLVVFFINKRKHQ